MKTNAYQHPAITESANISATVAMPQIWDQRLLAKYLSKSVAWCERARWEGTGPRYIKLGRHVRYRVEDVLSWMDQNVHTCTSMEG
jgi:predicted DNA-binding transcriptional regulator AlpA